MGKKTSSWVEKILQGRWNGTSMTKSQVGCYDYVPNWNYAKLSAQPFCIDS
jgi:hypothetical protein